MNFPKPIGLHDAIGRLSALLSGIGKAARIDQINPPLLDHGWLMGMPITDHLKAPRLRLLCQIVNPHGYPVSVAMSHPNAVFLHSQIQFIRQGGEEIIISSHHLYRAGGRALKRIFAPLNITAMNDQIRLM